jgi:hypothetical protein
MTQQRPDKPRNWADVIWDPHTDWETADLAKLREQANAEQIADGIVSQEWLDWYGDVSFDAALLTLGVLRGGETVNSVMAARSASEAARGNETKKAL